MAEYIKRETVLERAEYDNNYRLIIPVEVIKATPVADVAPVVHCKDCKHHYDCGVHFCDRLGMDCPDDSDFFCSYGERKDGGNENDR